MSIKFDKFLFMEINELPAVKTWKKRVFLLNLKNNQMFKH